MYHEMCDRVNLDHLDLICEALECNLSDILVWEPAPIKRTKSRSGNSPP
jgi:putative transcriptional regulator